MALSDCEQWSYEGILNKHQRYDLRMSTKGTWQATFGDKEDQFRAVAWPVGICGKDALVETVFTKPKNTKLKVRSRTRHYVAPTAVHLLSLLLEQDSLARPADFLPPDVRG